MTKFFYTAVNGSIVEFKLHSSQLNITIYDWDYEKSQLSTKKNRHIVVSEAQSHLLGCDTVVDFDSGLRCACGLVAVEYKSSVEFCLFILDDGYSIQTQKMRVPFELASIRRAVIMEGPGMVVETVLGLYTRYKVFNGEFWSECVIDSPPNRIIGMAPFADSPSLLVASGTTGTWSWNFVSLRDKGEDPFEKLPNHLAETAVFAYNTVVCTEDVPQEICLLWCQTQLFLVQSNGSFRSTRLPAECIKMFVLYESLNLISTVDVSKSQCVHTDMDVFVFCLSNDNRVFVLSWPNLSLIQEIEGIFDVLVVEFGNGEEQTLLFHSPVDLNQPPNVQMWTPKTPTTPTLPQNLPVSEFLHNKAIAIENALSDMQKEIDLKKSVIAAACRQLSAAAAGASTAVHYLPRAEEILVPLRPPLPLKPSPTVVPPKPNSFDFCPVELVSAEVMLQDDSLVLRLHLRNNYSPVVVVSAMVVSSSKKLVSLSTSSVEVSPTHDGVVDVIVDLLNSSSMFVSAEYEQLGVFVEWEMHKRPSRFDKLQPETIKSRKRSYIADILLHSSICIRPKLQMPYSCSIQLVSPVPDLRTTITRCLDRLLSQSTTPQKWTSQLGDVEVRCPSDNQLTISSSFRTGVLGVLRALAASLRQQIGPQPNLLILECNNSTNELLSILDECVDLLLQETRFGIDWCDKVAQEAGDSEVIDINLSMLQKLSWINLIQQTDHAFSKLVEALAAYPPIDKL